MTLFTAYIALGAAFALPGIALVSGLDRVAAAFRAFPRSLPAAVVFFGGGAAWFLWIVSQLGESDLAGFPRNWMLGIFGVTALLAFKFLSDLLAVRGLAVIMLLAARVLLDAGYMQQPQNLALSCTSYILIVLGIWWGSAPYVFRDWNSWILEKQNRMRISGLLLLAIGAVNLGAALLLPNVPQ